MTVIVSPGCALEVDEERTMMLGVLFTVRLLVIDVPMWLLSPDQVALSVYEPGVEGVKLVPKRPDESVVTVASIWKVPLEFAYSRRTCAEDSAV